MGWDGQAIFNELLERTGLPDIAQATKQIATGTTPYGPQYDQALAKELGPRLRWYAKYLATLGGKVPKLEGGGDIYGPADVWTSRGRFKNVRPELEREAQEFKGFGPALMPLAGASGVSAIEWGVVYPKMFQAMGMTGEAVQKIPQVRKATKAISAAGGIDKLAQKYPAAMHVAQETAKGFAKGAGVGMTTQSLETFQKDLEALDMVNEIVSAGATMGGIGAAFSGVAAVDTVRLAHRLTAQYAERMPELKNIPKADLFRTAQAAIDSHKVKIGMMSPDQWHRKHSDHLYKFSEQLKSLSKKQQDSIRTLLRGEAAPSQAQSPRPKPTPKARPVTEPPKSPTTGRTAKQPWELLASERQNTAEAERAAIDAFIAQFDDPRQALREGQAPANQPYLGTRDEQFARAVKVRRDAPDPVIDGGPSSLEDMEDARDAIRIGRRLGYRDSDILAYLSKNYGYAREAVAGDRPTPATPEQPPVGPEIDSSQDAVEQMKPHKAEILPRKDEIAAELRAAIAKAPAEPTEGDVEAFRKEQGTLHFEIDGGMDIYNTKEALSTALGAVQKLPKTETIPRRTSKVRGVGKPSAAKKETVRPLLMAPEGWWTDGNILVRGKPPAKAKKSDLAQDKPVDVDQIVKYPANDAELVGYEYADGVTRATSGRPLPQMDPESPPLAVFRTDGGYVAYDQGRFNVLRNRFPDATWAIVPPDAGHHRGLLYAKKDGKVVGALMPIRGDDNQVFRPDTPVSTAAEEGNLYAPQQVDVEGLRAHGERRTFTGPEPVDIGNVVVDRFRQWPEALPKPGKDFWTEVMATARELLTPLRYKALQQTVLGAFRYGGPRQRPDIELQDVRDVLSATHELGHNIDWLMNGKSFPRSIKLRFDDPAAKEGQLRQELKAISQRLRPDLWSGGANAQKYANRHTELMADYISHYILDPDATREVAPTVTDLFERKLAENPKLSEAVSRLHQARTEGPQEPPIAERIRETFPLAEELKPLQLADDLTGESYVKAAEELGIKAARHYKMLMHRARTQAQRIDKLVPDKGRQTDLVVLAENGSRNPWTGRTRQEILADGLTANERKALNLFRGYQEQARQTVNKYLRGADIAEYINFIEDYFIHVYQTPMSEKYRSAIARWAKRSPQAKKRVLPDLATAVEIGLEPKAKTLSDGLMLWAGINYRVATNLAFLRTLPKITNNDGMSVLQKPTEAPPDWPTVDYWPLRQTYAQPLGKRGVLLFQGRVAVDPGVKPFIDAMFGRRAFNSPVRIIEGINAWAKAMELTLFSLFHHQAEFFSAVGALGPRAILGLTGKEAEAFGAKPRLGGAAARPDRCPVGGQATGADAGVRGGLPGPRRTTGPGHDRGHHRH